MNLKENTFHAYEYRGHIDWLNAIMPAKKAHTSYYDQPHGRRDFNEDLSQVIQAFFAAGWEGDGNIGLIWIPDFIDSDICPATLIWHVKQQNNGTSFLACEHKLNFRDLEEKNYKKENKNGAR